MNRSSSMNRSNNKSEKPERKSPPHERAKVNEIRKIQQHMSIGFIGESRKRSKDTEILKILECR